MFIIVLVSQRSRNILKIIFGSGILFPRVRFLVGNISKHIFGDFGNFNTITSSLFNRHRTASSIPVERWKYGCKALSQAYLCIASLITLVCLVRPLIGRCLYHKRSLLIPDTLLPPIHPPYNSLPPPPPPHQAPSQPLPHITPSATLLYLAIAICTQAYVMAPLLNDANM